MKKRIERWPSLWLISASNSFQRKAHEKEDWEALIHLRIIFLSSRSFREKLMKKRIESLKVSETTVALDIVMFQRKAHEKEDWECYARYFQHDRFTLGFREKLMKKRIERWESCWMSTRTKLMRFREKLMKKRIERLALHCFASKGLTLRFREKLMKKRIERCFWCFLDNFNSILGFREKLMKKRIERQLPSEKKK